MHRSVPWRGLGATAAAVVTTVVVVASVAAMTGPVPHDALPQAARVDVGSAYYAGCGEQAVAEPAAIPIWCQSSDQRLENLAWSSWGGGQALATGLLTDDGCDCATGTTRTYPVAVRFDAPTAVGEVSRYQRLSITFAGDRPEWATRRTMHFTWGDLGFLSDQERA